MPAAHVTSGAYNKLLHTRYSSTELASEPRCQPRRQCKT